MRTAAGALALAVLAGCGGGSSAPAQPSAPPLIRLSGPFPDGGAIPREDTCAGAGRQPALRWSGVPAGTRELVLVVEDPDAPGGTFTHWTRFGLPASARTVRGGADGTNSFGVRGWRGPCPPPGDRPHRYRFVLYALGAPSGLRAGASVDAVHRALAAAHPLARGELVGRFGR